MNTGKRMFQKIIAVLLIFMLISADFALAGQIAVSYAIDAVKTNNKNVEILAYFENENGDKISNIENVINSDLKLVTEITVKNENGLGGYFDGNIILENSNFEFINKNEISVHVNSGETKRYEEQIKYAEKNDIDSSYLNQESKININGTYVNSKKEYDIKGDTEVTVNWKAPDNMENLFSVELLTNSIYTQSDDQNKRIVQLLLKSNLEDNLYPVKNTNITLNVPNDVENVSVSKRTTNATNRYLEFGSQNYEYNEEKKSLTINIENDEQDNKISWEKNAIDSFVVTFECIETVNLINSKIDANCKITTYDDKTFEVSDELVIENEIDGIITTSIIEGENDIYKGKLYSGENRTYLTSTKVNIDYIDGLKDIQINENGAVFVSEKEEKFAKIFYESTIISKQEFNKLFGDNGYITIADKNDNIIATINKDSGEDENGNIIINYDSEITDIVIKTSKPIEKGTLNINHKKKIVEQNYLRKEIKNFSQIKENVETIYNLYGDKQNTTKISGVIRLNETLSKASIDMETTSISTTGDDQSIHLKIILDTNNESYDLYKNPTLKITFPSQIVGIYAKYAVLYSNGLTKKQAKIVEEDGKQVLIIEMNGEQEKYQSEAVDGTIIELLANVSIDNLAVSSKEEINVQFSNENATSYADDGIIKAGLNIVAENSMILTNNAKNANINILGGNKQEEVKLDIDSKQQSENINMQIINNEGNDISNIKILGDIPYVENKIELDDSINTNKDVKVYYSNLENATSDLEDSQNGWTEDLISNPKKYLILADNLEHGENIAVSYNLDIAENLDYNIKADEKYEVSYTNSETGIETAMESGEITFLTGTVAVISQNVTAVVGKDEITNESEVNAGEIIKYTVSIVNDGYEKAENVIQTVKVLNGGTLMKINPDYLKGGAGIEDIDEDEVISEDDDNEISEYPYFIEVDNNELKTENITINPKQTLNYTYYVKVNSEVDNNSQVNFEISTNYNEDTKTNNMINNVKSANLSAQIVPLDRFETEILQSNFNYLYKLIVKNISSKEQKDVKVTLNKNDMINILGITYEKNDGDEYEIVEVDVSNSTFTIEKLNPGEEKEIIINTVINNPTDDLNETEIYGIIEDKKENQVRSNVIKENVEGIVTEMDIVSSVSTDNASGYLKPGDKITYTINAKNAGIKDVTDLEIVDDFSDYLDIETIKVNGKEVEYEVENKLSENYKAFIIKIAQLKVMQSVSVEITGKVKDNILSDDLLNVTNIARLYGSDTLLNETKQITNIIQSNQDVSQNAEDIGGESNNNVTYSVSGVVWLDENKNGSRDTAEAFIDNVTVYAIDTTTNEFVKGSDGTIIKSTTDEQGKYTLNLPKGEYLIVFEYNTQLYTITTYQAENALSTKNSDAIKSSLIIDGQTKEVAKTDNIKLTSNINDIDLGLKDANEFNLELNKYVTKMVVTNSKGTNSYEQKEDATLSKVEIASKALSGTNVVIEYVIKITNKGEAAGYVKNIVDYLPSELSFSSNLNQDWYQSGEYIYNSSLENILINPGETKEVKLILTKVMTSSNTGLINNKAEIVDSFSAIGTDRDNENNKGSADIIIGIKTGGIISYILLTLTIICGICAVAYLVNKFILQKRLNI